jgi:hypothetical protein
MSNAENDDRRAAARTRLRRRLTIGGLLILLLLLAPAPVKYLIDWNMARLDRRDTESSDYLKAYQTFLEDLDADRLDAAYQSTTAAFQKRVSREQFEQTAQRYLAFKRKPDARGIESESSGPAGGDHRGPNRMVFTHTLEDQQGTRRQSSITVEQQDSLLKSRPPPPRVGEFKVSNVSPEAPEKP